MHNILEKQNYRIKGKVPKAYFRTEREIERDTALPKERRTNQYIGNVMVRQFIRKP